MRRGRVRQQPRGSRLAETEKSDVWEMAQTFVERIEKHRIRLQKCDLRTDVLRTDVLRKRRNRTEMGCGVEDDA